MSTAWVVPFYFWVGDGMTWFDVSRIRSPIIVTVSGARIAQLRNVLGGA